MENPTTQPKYKILDYVYAIVGGNIIRATITGVNISHNNQSYVYTVQSVEKGDNNKWYRFNQDYPVFEENISQSKEEILNKYISFKEKLIENFKLNAENDIKNTRNYLGLIEE